MSDSVVHYQEVTDSLGVAPFAPRHVDTVARWLSDDPFTLFLTSSTLTFPVTPATFEAYRQEAGRPQGVHEFLAVYHRPTAQHIGHFEVKAINHRHGTGTLAHVLLGAKEFRGKGLGKELCHLMARYGFRQLGLARLGVSVHLCNRVAVAAYVRGGFQIEGVLRDVVALGEQRYSLYQMSLLLSEWGRGESVPGT